MQTDGFPPTVRTELNAQWKISGTVSSENGRPLSNVKIYLSSGGVYNPERRSYLRTTTSEISSLAGKYTIDVDQHSSLIFHTPGFAPLSVKVPNGSLFDVQLEIGRSISGTILLPSGAPAAGAKITPVQWLTPRPEKLPQYGDRIDPDNAHATMAYRAMPNFGADRAVKTNEEGKFQIHNVPDEFRVGLAVKAIGTKEEIIYVRPDRDAAEIDFKNQILESNEFAYKLKASAVLKLSATHSDTGNPAAIAKVSFQPNSADASMARSAPMFRVAEEFDNSSVTASMIAYKNGSIVLIEPKDNENYLGVRIELPANGQEEIIEKEIEFPRGKSLNGIVTSLETGKPIPGVQLRWRSDESKEWDQVGNFPNPKLETDQNGEFVVAVPDNDGILGITGDVPGHRSVGNWNQQANYLKYAPTLLKKFTRELKQGKLDDHGAIHFELLPSFQIEVKVVDEKGQPVNNCIVSGHRPMTYTMGAHYPSKKFSATTDESGLTTLQHCYQDAYSLAVAQFLVANPSNSQNHLINSHYPLTLQAFTDDGFFQGSGTVPLPPVDADSKIIPATINLLPSANVIGQITDTDGKGIADLKVLARGNGQTWTTKTKSDGWFKMTGLWAGAKLQWIVDERRVKTMRSSGRIEIDISGLRQGETLQVAPIACIDFTELAGELPEIEIGGLSNEKALEVLETYLLDSVDRIPKNYQKFVPNSDDPNRKFFNSRSSGDPIPAYRNRLAQKAIPVIKELAARDPGSDFEFKLLVQASASLNGGMLSRNTFQNYCLERLIADHAERESAQNLLIQLSSTSFSSDGREWENVLEATTFEETKLVAAYRLVYVHLNKAVQNSHSRTEAKVFDTHLANLEKYIRVVENNKVEGTAADTTRKKWLQHIKNQLHIINKSSNQPVPAPDSTTLKESREIMIERYGRLSKLLNEHLLEK